VRPTIPWSTHWYYNMARITIPKWVQKWAFIVSYLTVAASMWYFGLLFFGSPNEAAVIASGIVLAIAMMLTTPMVVYIVEQQSFIGLE
jgi:hypothetical protein